MEFIRLCGVRQNNLKNISLDIPVGRLVVVTGLSGAGKSSLVFDTLHAEGQRRYVETFSPYVRQFLDLMPPPKLDAAENIRPSVAVRQTNGVKTTRSTVGTLTELCDLLKTWFAHRATLHDPATGEPLRPLHPDAIVTDLLRRAPGATALLTFAVAKPEKLAWADALAPFAERGFTRVLADGAVRRLDDTPADTRELAIIQDRVKLDAGETGRLREAVSAALTHGLGRIRVTDATGARLADYAEGLVSPATGKRYREASPAMFSFNSPLGACPACKGFGRVLGLDWKKIIPDPTLSVADGAIAPFSGEVYGESLRETLRACAKHGVPTDVPWAKLSAAQREFLIEGEPGYGVDGREWPRAWYGIRRFFTWLESTAYKMHVRVMLARYRDHHLCEACASARLMPESLLWKWRGATLPELYALPVSALRERLAETGRA